ncbi:hypothetical protein A2V71_00470 [Candidatus Berkelbacteria bacterium RBG_13_40_8]|uniref:Sortase n=1 Tax=Candidatus Berkelbacteria bacterium RBG_13_40_8 TaxID=1797467 RepID=A0A1F5DQ66_9BACT|nr:MAG: hypothetical protein A2V71_00470 [Candidatus Berkelbacteria bacterium RBG_13_40_8]
MNQPFFDEKDIREIFEPEKPASLSAAPPVEVEFQPAAPLTKPQKIEFEKDFLAIPKLILKFFGVFLLIFAISYTIINAPALVLKMKYFWETDYRNQPWGTEANLATLTVNESRLVIPKIRVDAPIIWNVAEANITESLQNGVVHYQGTALPGDLGNVFITGHSSYYLWAPGSYKDVFALLNKLGAGDKIYIQYGGATFTYEVTDQQVVSPDRLDVLSQANENILTLMTCVPVGTSLNRLIVTAKQI